MPKLRINISGLCFCAFNNSLKGAIDGVGPKPTRVDLLMQRLIRAEPLVHNHQVLDQHFPLLEFRLADLSGESTRSPSYSFQWNPNTDRMERGGCLLAGDDLTILVDGNPLSGGDLNLSVHQPQSSSDLNTVWWMPTLEHAFPGVGSIEQRFITTPPSLNTEILARLPLTDGTLTTGKLSDSVCTFVFGDPTFRRQIATRLKFEIDFTSKVEIDILHREQNTETRTKLAFVPPGGADLDLELKNSEIDESIGLPRYGNLPEADFEIYTRLLPESVRSQIPPASLVAQGAGNSAGVTMGACPPGS